MVAIQSRLDDVLLSTKGKKVEADHQVTRTIPAMCSENGKTRRITLDISEEGERELAKLDKKYKDLLLEAGRVYAKLAETRIEARAAKPRKRRKKAEAPAQDENNTETPQKEPPSSQEETPDVKTAPVGSSFGSGQSLAN